jgi:hypothetical protein
MNLPPLVVVDAGEMRALFEMCQRAGAVDANSSILDYRMHLEVGKFAQPLVKHPTTSWNIMGTSKRRWRRLEHTVVYVTYTDVYPTSIA